MVGAVLQIFALLLFALFPLSRRWRSATSCCSGIGAASAQQPFFQLWSGEMFPTLMRSTAQGLMFAVVRISLGIWSFFVPAITKRAFTRWPGSSPASSRSARCSACLRAVQRRQVARPDPARAPRRLEDDEPRFIRERDGAGVGAQHTGSAEAPTGAGLASSCR